jgi:hypothetical protein
MHTMVIRIDGLDSSGVSVLNTRPMCERHVFEILAVNGDPRCCVMNATLWTTMRYTVKNC